MTTANTHVEAPRHALSGGINSRKVSAQVPLVGHFTLALDSDFPGILQLERSTDGGNAWTVYDTFSGPGLFKRYEPQAALYRLNGAKLGGGVGFKLFDHAAP